MFRDAGAGPRVKVMVQLLPPIASRSIANCVLVLAAWPISKAAFPPSGDRGLLPFDLDAAQVDAAGGTGRPHLEAGFGQPAPATRLMRSQSLHSRSPKDAASLAEAVDDLEPPPADVDSPVDHLPAPNFIVENANVVKSGIESCEGHGYGRDECEDIECCQYKDKQCWSSVGDALCEAKNVKPKEKKKDTDLGKQREAPEKAVDKCDYGPAQAGTYQVSERGTIEQIAAGSARLCQQACCANPRCAAFVYEKKTRQCQLTDKSIELDTFTPADDFVSAVKAGAVDRTATGKAAVHVNIMIGSSDTVQKCVDAPPGTAVVCAKDAAASTRRINKPGTDDEKQMKFAVTVGDDGNKICAQRTDLKEGWDMNLAIKCREASEAIKGMGPGTASDAIAASSDANTGGARFYSLKIDKGSQKMIRICEVKLMNAEMENVASKALVSFQADPEKPEKRQQEDLLTDHQFFSQQKHDQDDACVMWDKSKAGKKLVQFEFTDAVVITAVRVYSTRKEEFGERAQVLAAALPGTSPWKLVLSTSPSQGLTIEFDSTALGELLPEGGNQACPTCMEEEGFPAAPNEPPHAPVAQSVTDSSGRVSSSAAAAYAAGPRGAQGEPGEPGKTPPLRAGPPAMTLVMASFMLNAILAGACLFKFRSDYAEKFANAVGAKQTLNQSSPKSFGDDESDAASILPPADALGGGAAGSGGPVGVGPAAGASPTPAAPPPSAGPPAAPPVVATPAAPPVAAAPVPEAPKKALATAVDEGDVAY